MGTLTIRCSKCRSKDVRRDAWAGWDEVSQKWVLEEVYDAGFCMSCQGSAHLIIEELEESDGSDCNVQKGCHSEYGEF